MPYFVRQFLKKTLILCLIFSLVCAQLFSAIPHVFAATSPWAQTSWDGGSGQTSWSDSNKYSASSNIESSVSNELSLSKTEEFTNTSFTSSNSGWSTSASAPSGWVEVPGSGTYSTSNFLVMKYEAKCALNSAPTVGLTSPASANHIYINNASASGTPCTSANSRQVVSVASGYPIASITQDQINTNYCGAVQVGSGNAHLITNAEWMTVARNIEAQSANWSLGAVGSGYLYAGHSDNTTLLALPASTTDTGNYACAYTDGTDPTIELPGGSCPTNTANGQSATAGNQRRVHTLSNGSRIWDLAGNINEYVNETITQANEPDAATTATITSEFTSLLSYGTLSYDLVRPLGSTYDSSYGVGRMAHHSNSASSTVAAIFRGGGGNNGLTAGVFAMRFDIAPNSSAGSGGIGFRCASNPVNISQTWSSSTGVGSSGGNTVAVGSVSDGLLTQTIDVGDTFSYEFSAYVYDNTSGNIGGTVSSSIAQLYANGATVSTTYTNMGSGWWKLSGVATGVASSTQYGLLIKTGKTIIADDFSLNTYGDVGTLTSSIFDIGNTANMGTLTYIANTPVGTDVNVKVRTSNDPGMSGASSFSSCTAITSGSDISSNSCVSDSDRYVQYQVTESSSSNLATPTFTGFSLSFSENTPTSFAGTPQSDTSISWSWVDNADNELGFYIKDSENATKCTVSSASSGTGETVTCTETGLNPNTSYTRNVVAYYTEGNSTPSDDATAVTYSIAPTTGNITSSQTTNTLTKNPSFTFSNTSGFGTGNVEYFRYVFNISSSYIFTDTEPQWTSSTLLQTAITDSNSWYLHLKAYNSANMGSGTVAIGPYIVDTTPPNIRITDIGLISDIPNRESLMYYFTSETPYIKGTTEANSTVHFKSSSHHYVATAKSSGKYEISISNPDLPRARTELTYYSVDQAGNKSEERTLTLIIGTENFPATPLPTTDTPTPTPTLTITPSPTTTDEITPTPSVTAVEDDSQDDKQNGILTTVFKAITRIWSSIAAFFAKFL